MTMQKVRLKALKNNKFSILPTDKGVRQRRDRITKAIDSTWTFKNIPEHIKELIIERACLRAEITRITIDSIGTTHSNASVLISERLTKIELINKKINKRKSECGHNSRK